VRRFLLAQDGAYRSGRASLLLGVAPPNGLLRDCTDYSSLRHKLSNAQLEVAPIA
jgi:hypothetical protein